MQKKTTSSGRGGIAAIATALTALVLAPCGVAHAQDPAGAELAGVVQARAAFEKAMEFAEQGKPRDALGPAEESVALFEKALGPDDGELIEPLTLVSNMRRDAGDLRGAEAPLVRALTIAERVLGEFHESTAIVLNNLGVLYRQLGMYARARPYYERALAVRERVLGPGHADTGQSHTNLGILLREVGEYADAYAELLRGAGITEIVYGREDPRMGVSVGMLAALASSQGDYAEAEQLYRRALEIHEKTLGPEHRTTLVSLNNLANHDAQIGAYEEARALHERALEIRTRVFGPEHPETLSSLGNLAAVDLATGDTVRARPLLERALAISLRIYASDSEQIARRYGALANLEMLDGNLDAAEQYLRKALETFEAQLGPDHPRSASTLAALGTLYMMRGDFAAARPYLRRAVGVTERTLGIEHPSRVAIVRPQVELLWATGQIDEAVDLQRIVNDATERELIRNLTTGSEQRKLSYLELTASELDWSISLHQRAAPASQKAARLALEVILRRKGRALDAMTGQTELLRRRASPDDRALLRELAYARAEYARRALSVPAARDDTYLTELGMLDRRVQQLEAQAADRSAEFRATTLPVTLDGVREGIPAGAALVEFASYEPFDPRTRTSAASRYAVYVLDGAGVVSWADLGPAAEVDGLVTAWRSQLRGRANEASLRVAARALDERVMRPVRRLTGNAVRRLLVSPDGDLNLLPFAALVDETGAYLVERFDIVYLTSGRELLRLRPGASGSSTKPASIVANPDYGPGAAGAGSGLTFRPLPGTQLEARDIGRLFPGAVIRTGLRATESALKQEDAPPILHIATHGFYLGAPPEPAASVAARRRWEAMRDVVQVAAPGSPVPSEVLASAREPLVRSGLGLAGANRGRTTDGDDGLLTALEVAGLDLWGTQLVVLSACDTGVGEVRAGNGLYGLRRALTLAGSQAQVTSLWAVSDRSTRELMVGYYRELLAGRGRSEALRSTQLGMLRNPRRRHPFYWAGFVPSGAWWPLDGVTAGSTGNPGVPGRFE